MTDLIFIVVSVWIFGAWLNTRLCPTCRRLNAMVSTSVIEIRKNNEEWMEYRCQYCDFRDWRKRVDGGGGGGG